MARPSPWWHPDRHADRRPFLLARARILSAIRRAFDADEFLEVESSALQVSPGNETHLHGFATDWIAPDGATSRLYLHTSPEFGCKKLLAAGEERIFAVAQVFRNREIGPLHNPEFTMLEWYRAHQPYDRLMEDCTNILALAAAAAGADTLRFRTLTSDPCGGAEKLTVADAFSRYAGLDLLDLLPAEPDGQTNHKKFAQAASDIGVHTAPDDTWSDIFSRVMADRIERNLGIGRPTLLYEYPASEAALARRKPGDTHVAERFELYVCGVELANGFGELTDPVEQRLRFEADMAEKQRLYGEAYPLDCDLLDALAFMPPASGVALGIDRLVMLATGADRIEQVLWTPFALAGSGTAP